MVRFIIILFFFQLLIYSCYEKDIELDGDNHSKRLVIFGVLSPNEKTRIQIYSDFRASSQPSSYTDLFVENAIGLLLENGKIVDSLFNTNGNVYELRNNTQIKSGYNYQMKFSAPDFPNAYSEIIKIPEEVPKLAIELDTANCTNLPNNFIGCRISIQFGSALLAPMLIEFRPTPTLSSSTSPLLIENNAGSNLCQESGYEYLRVIPSNCDSFGSVSYYLPIKLIGSRDQESFYNQYVIKYGYITDSYFDYIGNYSDQLEYSFSILFEPAISSSNIVEGSGFLGAIHDTIHVINLK